MSPTIQFLIGLFYLSLGVAAIRDQRGYIAALAYFVVIITAIAVLIWLAVMVGVA